MSTKQRHASPRSRRQTTSASDAAAPSAIAADPTDACMLTGEKLRELIYNNKESNQQHVQLYQNYELHNYAHWYQQEALTWLFRNNDDDEVEVVHVDKANKWLDSNPFVKTHFGF